MEAASLAPWENPRRAIQGPVPGSVEMEREMEYSTGWGGFSVGWVEVVVLIGHLLDWLDYG